MLNNDWESFIPLCGKELAAESGAESIFNISFNGMNSTSDKRSMAADEKSSKDLFGAAFNIPNSVIVISAPGSGKPFFSLAINKIRDYSCLGTDALSLFLPFYTYNADERVENISDWALHLFNNHYRQNEPSSPVCYAGSAELREEFRLEMPMANINITKEAIFNYVYAVLHHPAYCEKYELHLNCELPRIPLYDNFPQWAAWGKQLVDLHTHYETAIPYPLERKEVATTKQPKVTLRTLKEEGIIQVDDNTELHNIPNTAWDYKFGNRSALEWILNQYNEKKPSAPTIAEQSNNYNSSDNKERLIDLLQRVCTISVETMKIIGEMP